MQRYEALAAKVDAFFARTHARYASDMQCEAGCHDCCQPGLTVTGVEAAAIRALVSALPADARARLAARGAGEVLASDGGASEAPAADALATRGPASEGPAAATTVRGRRCAALEEDGRCGIYAARPLVCRSHGVPVRFTRPGRLPVVESCPKNFTRGADAVAGDCVLDQTTLSTVLLAVDAAHAADSGSAPGVRTPLSALLCESPAAPGSPAAPAPRR